MKPYTNTSRKSFLKTAGFCATLLMSIMVAQPLSAQSTNKVLAMVNDHPVSAFDVKQRVKLRLLGSKEARELLKRKFQSQRTKDRFREFMIAARPSSRQEADRVKNRFIRVLRDEVQNTVAKKMRKATLEELINEALMLQEAKKQNIVISDDTINNRLKSIAGRNKNPKTGRPLTVKEFFNNLKAAGVSQRTYTARMKASIAFQEVVIRKYGRRMRDIVGDQQLDRMMEASATATKNTEFKVHKVKLNLNGQAGQQAIAKRFLDAETLRSKFTTCSKIDGLVKNVQGASSQALGARTLKQLPEASRAFFKVAEAGQMTPPSITKEGVVLYAVCSRRNIKGDEKQRTALKNKLRQQEFQLLRRRYLRDIRQDAFIEYR